MPPDSDCRSRVLHGQSVYGLRLDAQTRCHHWHAAVDVVALRLPCCPDRFWACADCHDACAGHPMRAWPAGSVTETAALCGACGHLLPVAEYLAAYATGSPACPHCHTSWNPGCRNHLPRYFEALVPDRE